MDTIQCPHCGTQNDTGRALCANCQSPLTAYAGQLRGETYEGKLAGHVGLLKGRPISVSIMAGFLVFIAVAWPLRAIYSGFAVRPHLNSEGTNYLASAFGAIGPLMISIACLPLAAVLVWIAWSAFTQQTRGWQFSLIALGSFAAYILIRAGEYRNWSILWVGATAILAGFWFHKSTKSWYGMS